MFSRSWWGLSLNNLAGAREQVYDRHKNTERERRHGRIMPRGLEYRNDTFRGIPASVRQSKLSNSAPRHNAERGVFATRDSESALRTRQIIAEQMWRKLGGVRWRRGLRQNEKLQKLKARLIFPLATPNCPHGIKNRK